MHSRLITHAEEIAFYGGNASEKHVLVRAYDAIVKQARLTGSLGCISLLQANIIYSKKLFFVMLEQYFMKVCSCNLATLLTAPAVPVVWRRHDYDCHPRAQVHQAHARRAPGQPQGRAHRFLTFDRDSQQGAEAADTGASERTRMFTTSQHLMIRLGCRAPAWLLTLATVAPMPLSVCCRRTRKARSCIRCVGGVMHRSGGAVGLHDACVGHVPRV